jgi:histidinol phosphatase-like enzyme
MLLQAAKQWQIDLSRSFFVGDAVSDLEAGWAAGCQTVLVKTGRGKAQLQIAEAGRSDFHVAESLFDAAHWIYQQLVCEQLEQGLTHPMPQLKA